MPRWLPSIPYPPSQDGYWSPITSTINWCEEDYYATIYSAEVVNSVTNLLFMYLAGKGIINCKRNDHPSIFFVLFAGYLVIGVGSFLFHNTLKYPMQLIDELSMIYTTCIMWYATFSHGKTRLYSIILAVALSCLALFITGYYHYLKDPTFHQNAYAILTAIVLIRTMYLMEIRLRPSLRSNEGAKANGTITGKTQAKNQTLTNGRQRELNQANGRASTPSSKRRSTRGENDDKRVLRDMWFMISYGLVMLLGGFTIWSLDIKYCSTLRSWRKELGLPWGMLLEGHGWWHLMTGMGGYVLIVWSIWLRHCIDHRQAEYELHWPHIIGTVPSIVRKKPKERLANVKQNGSLKNRKKIR